MRTPVSISALDLNKKVLEQDTGFKPALTAWKAVVLVADTNPAYIKGRVVFTSGKPLG